jgi:uncharacterized protein DUF6804
MARGKGGGLPPAHTLLKWPAWALGLLALASAFAPLPGEFLRGLHWALTLFAILEAGVALAHRRRVAIALYAAIAVLMNPFRPFLFPLQWWRLIHAGAGIWLCADHVGERS